MKKKIYVKTFFMSIVFGILFIGGCKKQKTQNLTADYKNLILKEFKLVKIFETRKKFNYIRYTPEKRSDHFCYSNINKRYILFVLLSKLNCNSCLFDFRQKISSIISKEVAIIKFRENVGESFILTGKKYPSFLLKKNGLLKNNGIKTGPVFLLYDKLSNNVIDLVIRENNEFYNFELDLFVENIKRKIFMHE